MSNLIKPHGRGDLKPLLLEGDELSAESKHAASLPKVPMTSRNRCKIIQQLNF